MENDDTGVVYGPPQSEADEGRRGLMAVVLGLFGAGALSACSSSDSQMPSTSSALFGAAADIVVTWVDTVLGPDFPTNRLSGDLSSKTSSDLDSSGKKVIAIARGCRAVGDGGGGVFYWSTGLKPDGTAFVDDAGTVIVPGGSILATGTSGCWVRLHTGPLDIRWFGASPASTAGANATCIGNALTATTPLGGVVQIPPGSFVTNPLTVPAGCAGLVGPGTLVAPATADTVALLTVTGGVGLSITGLGIVCESGNVGPAMAIRLRACRNCTIRECRIVIAGVATKSDVVAIKVETLSATELSEGNRVLDNTIELPATGDSTKQVRGVLVSGVTVACAGYFVNGGATLEATAPVNGTIVRGNRICSGTHGIHLNGACRSVLEGNQLEGQRDRSIELSVSCNDNAINSNNLTQYVSSAVIVSYGSHRNAIVGNVCVTNMINGEGAIQLQVGCSSNIIADNQVHSFTHYGIYISCGVHDNMVSGNRISGYRIAGIAIEGDWIESAPSYGRKNYGSPSIFGGSAWAFARSARNRVLGNTVGLPGPAPYIAGGTCGIFLSAIGQWGLQDTVVTGNVVAPDGSPTDALCTYHLNSDSRTVSQGNTLYRSHTVISDIADVNINKPIVVGDGMLCASSCTIDDFVGAPDGTEFTLRCSAATTIKHGPGLRLKGGVDVTGVTSNQFLRFRRESGVWFEVARNF